MLEYAAAGSEVRAVLEARIAEMEARSSALQEALLAELSNSEGGSGGGAAKPGKKGKKKKKGQQGKAKAAALTAALAPASPVAAAAPAADDGPPQVQPQQLAAPQQPAEQPSEQQASPTAPVTSAGVELSSEGRPGSPQWRLVARRKREEACHLHSLSQRHLDPSPGPGMPRCPSASSLGSSCR